MAEYRHSAHATFDLKYHLIWITKYFCATVGAVDEQMVKAYIENQKWDEDDQGFKITAPTGA